MGKCYMDFDLIKKYPNKYNLTPKKIKTLKILDWKKLKELTWYNQAMKRTGNWWCHLEGCQLSGGYDGFNEFWIGFNEDNDKIDFHFTTYEGMCSYKFEEFYNWIEIENKYDLKVQVNAIRFLNKLIDEKILGIDMPVEEANYIQLKRTMIY